ncbi:chromatin complexes subunit BAP18 [Hydra vulgaris]|uniref:Chromatin complexes subunit BAP18 n=1 Tax=Hydra vulgaris TaxID=6087 RepID=A0ABM4BJ24_HYDVU
MSQAGKVAEIFTLAGETFMKLGTLAMSLQQSSDKIQDNGKWGDEEVEMLKKAISQFGEDIEKISTVIRTKSASQIKAALKQKTVQNLTTAKGRPQLPISIQPRHAGMKSKANNIVYSHENIPDESSKKTKVETSSIMSSRQTSMSVLSSVPQTLNVLSSISTQNKLCAPNTTQNGVPVLASSQGFQVILPQNFGLGAGSVTMFNSGVIQHVADANTSLNVDVES